MENEKMLAVFSELLENQREIAAARKKPWVYCMN